MSFCVLSKTLVKQCALPSSATMSILSRPPQLPVATRSTGCPLALGRIDDLLCRTNATQHLIEEFKGNILPRRSHVVPRKVKPPNRTLMHVWYERIDFPCCTVGRVLRGKDFHL